jgi:glycosyltransferase involved in cell wall biosynthesis
VTTVRVFMNFREVRGPYGGTNSFLRTLRNWLRAQPGVAITHDPGDRYDVALLSGLTDGVNLDLVRTIHARGIPIVHRKVGYRVSGSPEMRRMTDGVVWGDKLQVDFTPYVAHTIFQSGYSRDVFLRSGLDGPYTVIHNGVDETIFNQTVTTGWLRRRQVPRPRWDGREPLRVVISTWSTDPNKGFEDYLAIDRQLQGRRDVVVSLVGRTPPGLRFRSITVYPAQRRAGLARILKRSHVVLQLARYETCSNALIEGINCGLPAIYLDSGSNAEIAACYGVRYEGNWDAALEAVRAGYTEYVERLHSNPFRISVVGPRYVEVMRQAVH